MTTQFKLVDYVVVKGRKVKYDSDPINAVLEYSTIIGDDYQYNIKKTSLQYMKIFFAPIRLDGTLK